MPTTASGTGVSKRRILSRRSLKQVVFEQAGAPGPERPEHTRSVGFDVRRVARDFQTSERVYLPHVRLTPAAGDPLSYVIRPGVNPGQHPSVDLGAGRPVRQQGPADPRYQVLPGRGPVQVNLGPPLGVRPGRGHVRYPVALEPDDPCPVAYLPSLTGCGHVGRGWREDR